MNKYLVIFSAALFALLAGCATNVMPAMQYGELAKKVTECQTLESCHTVFTTLANVTFDDHTNVNLIDEFRHLNKLAREVAVEQLNQAELHENRLKIVRTFKVSSTSQQAIWAMYNKRELLRIHKEGETYLANLRADPAYWQRELTVGASPAETQEAAKRYAALIEHADIIQKTVGMFFARFELAERNPVFARVLRDW